MGSKVTELQTFAKFTLENGGEWWLLEHSDNYQLYKTCSKYLYKNNYYLDTTVYQIFNKQGKRVFVSTDYKEAYKHYKTLCNNVRC